MPPHLRTARVPVKGCLFQQSGVIIPEQSTTLSLKYKDGNLFRRLQAAPAFLKEGDLLNRPRPLLAFPEEGNSIPRGRPTNRPYQDRLPM
jgi:hypothetical protein